MMKRLRLILIFVLCAGLLMQSTPATAEGSSAATTTKENEPTHQTKYTAKKIKNPPYCIVVNGNEDNDLSTDPWNAGDTASINIVGQRDDKSIAGEWQFFVSFYYELSGETEEIEGTSGTLTMGLSARLDGTGKGTMIDLVAKKKKQDEEDKKNGVKREPPPKQKPVHVDDPNTVKNSKEAPPELYQTEFEMDMKGTVQNTNGASTVSGTISSPSGSQWVTADMDLMSGDNNVDGKAKLKIVIDGDNNVIANLEMSGHAYGPYAGAFTCEEELSTKRKDTVTWPIWGVWTDVNPYEPMPNLTKDVTKINDQIKNNETPKKINYPEGRWVKLKQGKKEDPATYSTIEVSKEDITYETGEIWPYPGSAMFRPSERTVYSKDLQTVLKTDEPMEYELVITYSTASDTIQYPGFGRLVRVSDANLLGVWSSAGKLDMPDVTKVSDVPPGTWYEFVRGSYDDTDNAQRGFSAPYSFTRLVVDSDKSFEIDKGSAVIMPVADEELVLLTDLESGKEDETLLVSDFNKDGGTVLLGGREYTLIPGLALKGSWSSMNLPIAAPDAQAGEFSSKDENGGVVDPPKDAQWLSFDKEKKSFAWTQILESPDGILVRNGSYRTIGKDLLLLTKIKGSFYARPGTDGQSFKDEDYMYGEKLFLLSQEVKDEDPVSMSISGIGKFLPIEVKKD
jgi:hypothetical protein